MIKRITVVLILFSMGCESVREVKYDEKLKLYNDVLDQVVYDNYFERCLQRDARMDSARSNFYRGKLTEEQFNRVRDSLITVRKNELPRCVIDYTNEFQIFRSAHELPEDIRATIAERLKGEFFDDHFPDGSLQAAADSISKPAKFTASQLEVDHMDMVPNGSQKDKPYGEGIGVVAFSNLYFNPPGDRAVLFYEFTCGPSCGMGEVLFLEKDGDLWMITQYNRVWEMYNAGSTASI